MSENGFKRIGKMSYNNGAELMDDGAGSRNKSSVKVDVKNGSILLVDDEIDTLGILHSFLEESGFAVMVALSAENALGLLRIHTFDLLISDFDMPEMNGIELLQAASQADPDIVGIIMTGNGSVELAVEAMKAGAFDYLLKPFTFQLLLPICLRAVRVRQLRRSERRYRVRVDELTVMVKKLQYASKQPHTRELEIEELKEEIESLKTEIMDYKSTSSQWMMYDC
jgi:DNA-binding NtrC family response regulator